MDKIRCPWAPPSDPLYTEYHDLEWGVPKYDDRMLFELLILEGAQAGLSWRTILYRRENYRQCFQNFDPQKVAAFTPTDVEQLMQNQGIIRNRKKIESAISNAKLFLDIQKQHGSFSSYYWNWVDGKPIVNHFQTMKEVPAKTTLSEKISNDLYKRGMRFVGPVIMYAYMQSTGMVNDHLASCYRHREINPD
ncbi:MAG: DNA-3-methyladenine glycosylase I [Salinivirgaceae bacterium]|nr:DNA-3-methyladenine glycosylase I [Salinivirgaceae bacterium]